MGFYKTPCVCGHEHLVDRLDCIVRGCHCTGYRARKVEEAAPVVSKPLAFDGPPLAVPQGLFEAVLQLAEFAVTRYEELGDPGLAEQVAVIAAAKKALR